MPSQIRSRSRRWITNDVKNENNNETGGEIRQMGGDLIGEVSYMLNISIHANCPPADPALRSNGLTTWSKCKQQSNRLEN